MRPAWLVVFALGCRGTEREPSAVESYKAFNAELCACADAACAKQVEQTRDARVFDKLQATSDAELARVAHELERLEEAEIACYTKLVGHAPH